MLTVKILNTMHRIFLLVFLSILPSTGTLLAQGSDTSYQEITEVRIIKDFDYKYQRQLSRLRRVYPLAMHARMMLDDYENDLSGISKKRKQKKYTKKASKALKNDFHFDIKDLYQSEGKLLIRLIHRETDMTVSDILKKYRGGVQHSFQNGVAKLWGHNLAANYDPDGLDYVTEIVIADIASGVVDFDFKMNQMDREAYRKNMKDYRSSRKKSRKVLRKYRKRKRKQKRSPRKG